MGTYRHHHPTLYQAMLEVRMQQDQALCALGSMGRFIPSPLSLYCGQSTPKMTALPTCYRAFILLVGWEGGRRSHRS